MKIKKKKTIFTPLLWSCILRAIDFCNCSLFVIKKTKKINRRGARGFGHFYICFSFCPIEVSRNIFCTSYLYLVKIIIFIIVKQKNLMIIFAYRIHSIYTVRFSFDFQIFRLPPTSSRTPR